MTDKERIRAYVKRLQKPEGHGDYWKGYDSALNDILSFIDSLQEESVSEELEKAADTHANNCYPYGASPERIAACKYDFITGAKWQKQQDMKHGYVTALQGEKRFANYILEMIGNGWHIEAIKTACKDKINEE